jgi:hypothetical protein
MTQPTFDRDFVDVEGQDADERRQLRRLDCVDLNEVRGEVASA